MSPIIVPTVKLLTTGRDKIKDKIYFFTGYPQGDFFE